MESEVLTPEVVKDEHAIKEVINKVKSQGLFDQFRKECIADVDTKPAYHNLLQRVESYVEHFLQGQKWSLGANKNQLRETLRRQLHDSGMMQNGVERIIEQVVNPKILLGIKPKIDEAVCNHLGIDLKARQEEQQRRKQEQQKLLIQQIQEQQQLHSLQNKNIQNDDAFKNSGAVPPAGSNPWIPGMANFPSPSVPGVHPHVPGIPGNPQTMGGNFPGMLPPFSLMGGWMPGFSPGLPPMMPGQPMIPAFPGAPNVSPVAGMGPRPPFNSSGAATPVSSKPMVTSPQSSLVVTSSKPVIPDLTKPPPGLPVTPSSTNNASGLLGPSPGTGLPPGTTRVPPVPPGSVPPPPGTEPSSLSGNVPVKSNPIHSTATIPALLSHTLAKVSQDELTPEKIAVFKTAAAFITKTVNNAQGASGVDLASIFSPRVLAEAMMEDCGKPMSKQEIRAERRKERIKEYERQRAEREEKEMAESRDKVVLDDKENPLPPKHNLMDVFQAAEDVSDDEEAFNMLMDMDEEDKNTQGVVLSDDSDKDGEKPPTSQPGKRYNFAWDVDLNSDEMSDVTISSIHTSDMSSFEEDDLADEEEMSKDVTVLETSEEQAVAGDHEISSEAVHTSTEEADESVTKSATEELEVELTPSAEEDTSVVEDDKPVPDVTLGTDSTLEPPGPSKPVELVETHQKKTTDVAQSKPRKLVALSYNYSESEDEETREERKARIAKEKEERYLKRQQRRAELDAKKKERDEERARLKKEKQMQAEKSSETEEDKLVSTTDTTALDVQSSSKNTNEADAPSVATTPRKRKNKAEMKEQLLQQKVMERKAALRRKRTRNRRYASDEFTSIFSDTKKLNQSYTNDEVKPGEIVTFEGDGTLEIVEECVVETVGEEVETNHAVTLGYRTSADKGQPPDLVLQCPSPYSDISDRSMSERSEPERVSDPDMDKVSSDEELGELEEVKIVEELEDSSKGGASPSQSISESEVGPASDAPTPDTTRMSSSKSKSVISQDDEESISGQSVDKRKLTDTPGTQEEEMDSQTSLGETASSRSQGNKPLSDQAHELQQEVASPDRSPAKDLMANLELEPVSDEDSSLDGCLDLPETEPDHSDADKEDGEEKDSDKERKTPEHGVLSQEAKKSFNLEKSSRAGEEDNASDEGEIKSDSEEEKEKRQQQVAVQEKEVKVDDRAELEEQRRRSANRKPIHQVDFGEAEKRAREARVLYSGDQDRRGRGMALPPGTQGYRPGGFNTWSPAGTSTVAPHSAAKGNNRYMGMDPSSPVRSKSPSANFDAESEASSHSRSSVRVRDDVPPPYPIEGVNMGRKYRSPASSSDNAVDFKPVSPPSPVSSSSSRMSRTKTRSLSPSSRSSSYSSDSATASRKRKRSKRTKRKKRRKEKQRSKEVPSPVLSPTERQVSPRKSPDLPSLAAAVPGRERHLSSGNESISSDELPYFPDDEVEVVPKRKAKRSEGSSSSGGSLPANPAKRSRHDSSASISSSELIYSPTRTQATKEDNNPSDSGSSSSEKETKIKRRRSSSGKSSPASYDFPPVSPVRGTGTVAEFSPHGLSSPVCQPPLPDDMSGFQPPLPMEPVEPPPLPPLPPRETPPSPPCQPPEPPAGKSPASEIEEGEYPSSPETVTPAEQAQTRVQIDDISDTTIPSSFSTSNNSQITVSSGKNVLPEAKSPMPDDSEDTRISTVTNAIPHSPPVEVGHQLGGNSPSEGHSSDTLAAIAVPSSGGQKVTVRNSLDSDSTAIRKSLDNVEGEISDRIDDIGKPTSPLAASEVVDQSDQTNDSNSLSIHTHPDTLTHTPSSPPSSPPMSPPSSSAELTTDKTLVTQPKEIPLFDISKDSTAEQCSSAEKSKIEESHLTDIAVTEEEEHQNSSEPKVDDSSVTVSQISDHPTEETEATAESVTADTEQRSITSDSVEAESKVNARKRAASECSQSPGQCEEESVGESCPKKLKQSNDD